MQQNYFQLFNLPSAFSVDEVLLKQAFRALQRQFHPDRFVNASAQEQKIALQYATTINEAYHCLASPLLRAQYLLTQAGYEQLDHTLKNDPEFLMQQMHWREQLAAVLTTDAATVLLTEVRQVAHNCYNEFTAYYDQQNYIAAQQVVDKLQFITKFEKELMARLSSVMES